MSTPSRIDTTAHELARPASSRKEATMTVEQQDDQNHEHARVSLPRQLQRVSTVVTGTASLMFVMAFSALAQTTAPPPPPAGGTGVTVPDFTSQMPNGGNELLKIGGFIKWLAIFGCSAAFFGGLVCLGAGRLLDHRGAHRIGVGLMVSAVGVAILAGTGVALLNAFASGN